jgi:uncharacterized phiE125 gp8 family phage protein
MKVAAIRVVTAPANLPVTPAEFIEHARINGITVQVQPALLNRELAAATRRAERYLRRSILTQTVKVLFMPDGKTCECSQVLKLPRGNVQSVSSVTTSDGTTLDYTLEFDSILLASPAYGSVTVIYVSGYGDDAATVPASVIEGILEYAMTLYEDRPGARESKYASGGDALPKGVRDLWRTEQMEV